MRRLLLVLLPLVSCHLALGLEEATEVDDSSAGAGTGSCDSAAQCDDANPCSDDSCNEGTCVNAPISDGDRPADQQTAGDCKREVCAAGAPETLADGVDVPVDGNDCSDDVCDGMTPANPSLPGGTACATGVCSGNGSCVECFDNSQCTSPETCGGLGVAFSCGCTPTVTCGTRTCGTLQDAVCNNFVFCDNDTQDGSETDVDCGGSTATCTVRCNEGESCLTNADCGVDANLMPLVCPAGTCVPQ